MQADTIAAGIEALKAVYGDRVRTSTEGQRTLAIITAIELPPGYKPAQTDVLLVLDTAQAKPVHYVRPGQALRNGQPPKNPTITIVGGESWMTFSWDFPYAEGDSLCRFVAMIRERFERNE